MDQDHENEWLDRFIQGSSPMFGGLMGAFGNEICADLSLQIFEKREFRC